MSQSDDPQIEALTGAYLDYLRGEGPAPDLSSLNSDDHMKAWALFDLLDALADMGRELPGFQDAPLPKHVSLVGPRTDAALTPGSSSRRWRPERTPSRRKRPRFSRSLWAVAAAMTLVLAATTSIVVLGGSAPAGAVQVGTMTADCTTTFGRTTPAFADDKPHVVVAAPWAGEERIRFKEVLDQFANRTGINVSFATHDGGPDRDIGQTLERLEQQGCPPDVALLPQPGLLRELARNGRLTPLDRRTTRDVSRSYSPAWQELGKVDGTPYGVWFKAANKSIIWYNTNAFAKAGIDKPPSDWEGLKDAATKLHAVGIAPFAVAGQRDDGWVLSDWFENVYLRTASPGDYDRLAAGELPWTDPTVKGALAKLAEIFGRDEWMVGGRAGSLQLTYGESIRKVFGNPGAPEAAMVFEGDFVANAVAGTASEVDINARFFPFPSIGQYEPTVVGTGVRSAQGEAGGDVAVLMAPTDAGRRLLRYLASPTAAEPWVKAGGFLSPNKRVDLGDYRDSATRQAAEELARAESVRFDLSDLVDPEFGSRPGQGMWKVLQDFLAAPNNIDGTAQRLEDEYRAAQR